MSYQSTNTPPEVMLDFLSKHVDLCSLYGQNNIILGKNLAHDMALMLQEVINIDIVLARRPALEGIQRRFDKIVKILNTAALSDPNDKQAEYVKLLEDIVRASKNASLKLYSISLGDGFEDDLEKDEEYLTLQVLFKALDKFQGKVG